METPVGKILLETYEVDNLYTLRVRYAATLVDKVDSSRTTVRLITASATYLAHVGFKRRVIRVLTLKRALRMGR